jgi:lysophospholipase L1-like esterase
MGLTWMAIGDSITVGTGSTTYDKSYVYKTRVGLLDAGHPHYLVRAASGGQKSSDMIELHKSRGGKCDPDLITIMIGTNDNAQSVGTTTFQTNLNLLIDEAKKRIVVGKGKIVLLTMPWANTATTAYGVNVPQYNAIIQSVGTARNIPVCDIYPAFNSASFLTDDVHPNDNGHANIANILIPFLNNLDVWNSVRNRG